MPVHVVWGSEDTWIPVDRADRLRGLIPGATVHVVDEAGHLIQYDAPDELAVVLANWLARRTKTDSPG
jgi:pimeloyl-ACP methyl ester carboxylesterase